MQYTGITNGKKLIFALIICIAALFVPACALPQNYLPTALAIGLYMDSLDPMDGIPIPPPLPPMPDPNAFDYYMEAHKAFVEVFNNGLNATRAIDWTADYEKFTFEEKEAVLTEMSEVDELIHQGFAYPCQFPSMRSFSTNPDYGRLRGLARYLAFESRVKAEKGDWGGSMNASLDCLRLGVDVQQQAPMIGMLVGVALEAIGRSGDFWDLPKHLSKEQAMEAINRLEEIIAEEPSFSDVFRESKYSHQAFLLEIFSKQDWRVEYAGAFPIERRQLFATLLLFTSKPRIMRDYTAYMDKLIAYAELPYATYSPPQYEGTWFVPPQLPIFERARAKYIVNQTQNVLLLVSLALQAYHQEYGKYPSTLSELAPTYLQKIPDDPFAEEGPLKYILDGEKYRLYSIGPDGVDQEGKAIDDELRGSSKRFDIFDFEKGNPPGDIVAGVNVK